MQTDDVIGIEILCTSYDIEPSFIDQLLDHGLINIVTMDESRFLSAREINAFEKILRLHYDMDINFEGIETIIHLLDRMEQLQGELNELRNKLHLYEPD
ncbi:MAG TPA: chaperone modulator CbpM [Saprospiraceae bacterium]|nr:chaperone modulator CbpM [Saprospiraceae bacterium]